MMENIGAHIHITGVVQGVGFRPFIYGLAIDHKLSGWVLNTSAGVDIHIEGPQKVINSFVHAVEHKKPPLAYIDEIVVERCSPDGYTSFEIKHSKPIPEAFQPVSPDVSVCQDCLNELFDPNDRRYLYPFINCTNCGPRFTIIKDIPYDRPLTTMAEFKMCPECLKEYVDPLNRRFHAQPVACPVCGPHVWVEFNEMVNASTLTSDLYRSEASIRMTRALLAQGKIVAIKGLGGVHLACDALNQRAVAELRRRKLRVDKPFAVMMSDIETISEHCFISSYERELLESPERPVVILQERPQSIIPKAVAPYQNTLGVMLPYTPLHYLLFAELPEDENSQTKSQPLSVLVMTSGNISEEPIAIENNEARKHLANIADVFLLHNRSIFTRCDDSVMRVIAKDNVRTPYPIRRSRGYAPFPVHLAWNSPPITAVGGELKNTFCISRDRYAFLSQHIGNLENYETLESFEKGIRHYEHLFRIQPQIIAYDLHPNYLATRYALERSENEGITALGIQHHHAHIAACMAEHKLSDDMPVIGVAFDGTGYGTDGAIWGGEFLLSTYESFERIAHLKYTPLPGGDTAIRKPSRIALSHLWQAGLSWEPHLPSVAALSEEERLVLHSQLEHRINTPMTSSIGRLFDAVASIVGIRQVINYEAQAAIELEAIVNLENEERYGYEIQSTNGHFIIDPSQIIHSVVNDIQAGLTPDIISARFHNTLASMVLDVCKKVQEIYSYSRVVLSGGVWQNMTLLNQTVRKLETNGFDPYIHYQVPSNDGGIALGQAVIAARTEK
jgi:hydrogenase maturation protein HypF